MLLEFVPSVCKGLVLVVLFLQQDAMCCMVRPMLGVAQGVVQGVVLGVAQGVVQGVA